MAQIIKQKIFKINKSNPTLGGSMFIRNAIQFDYCVAEALESLCAVCDQAVVLDCGSTDGTLDLLVEVQKRNKNLKVVQGGNWECHENYERLRILADVAKSYLTTSWHFMLQADEVIHESSFPHIRKAIKSPNKQSFMIRRCNLFGDLNHYLRYDLGQEHKPCSDSVVRLATIENPAYGDAESLQVDPRYLENLIESITIFHYGFVRRDANCLDKTISMQSWFWGPNSTPDSRVVEMAKQGTRYDWKKMKSREMLAKITMDHPKFSKEWANERQQDKIPITS